MTRVPSSTSRRLRYADCVANIPVVVEKVWTIGQALERMAQQNCQLRRAPQGPLAVHADDSLPRIPTPDPPVFGTDVGGAVAVQAGDVLPNAVIEERHE